MKLTMRVNNTNHVRDGAIVGLGGVFIALWLACVVGYVRHVVWTISMLMADGGITAKQVILALFVFVPPLGAIHGWYVMLFG